MGQFREKKTFVNQQVNIIRPDLVPIAIKSSGVDRCTEGLVSEKLSMRRSLVTLSSEKIMVAKVFIVNLSPFQDLTFFFCKLVPGIVFQKNLKSSNELKFTLAPLSVYL